MHFKRYWETYLINLIALLVYIVVFNHLKIGIDAETLYSSTDAKAYRAVADWIGYGIETSLTYERPFLYPLILLISSVLAGDIGVWIMQFTLWLLTVNLVYRGIKELTKNRLLAFIGVFIFISNLTLITLTLHALTEVTVAFLLSSIVWVVSKNRTDFKSYGFIWTMLLLTSLLAVIKPLYAVFVPIILFVVIPIFYWKIFKTKTWLKISGVFIASIVFLVQLSIMVLKHDSFKISNIGNETSTYYFFAKGLQEINNIERQESRDIASTFSTKEKFNYIIENKEVYSQVYASNLKENLRADPTFLAFPQGKENWKYFRFMRGVNMGYYVTHIVFAFLTLTALILMIIKKRKTTTVLLLVLIIFLSSILLSSGLSFWQGDRLVAPAIVVWIPLYSFVLTLFLDKQHRII